MVVDHPTQPLHMQYLYHNKYIYIYMYMPSNSNSRNSKPQLNAIPVTLQHRHQTDDRRKTVEDNKRSMRNLGTIHADRF